MGCLYPDRPTRGKGISPWRLISARYKSAEERKSELIPGTIIKSPLESFTVVVLQGVEQRFPVRIGQLRIAASYARERKQSHGSSAFHFHIVVFWLGTVKEQR